MSAMPGKVAVRVLSEVSSNETSLHLLKYSTTTLVILRFLSCGIGNNAQLSSSIQNEMISSLYVRKIDVCQPGECCLDSPVLRALETNIFHNHT